MAEVDAQKMSRRRKRGELPLKDQQATKNIKKKKRKRRIKQEEQEVDRRRFIEKSARDIGACGFAFYELAKTIKDDIVREVVEDIKKTIKKFHF